MKLVEVLKKVGMIYLYLVGLLFILLSFDCFGDAGCADCSTFWENLLCFLISILPGVLLILLNYFLRKHSLYLGSLLIALSIALFFVLKFYREFSEKIPMFIILIILPIAIGILHLVYPNEKKDS